MSKLKYALTLVVGIAMGGSGTYFSRNLSNQRSMDENYLAGKENGMAEGIEKSKPEFAVGDFNDDKMQDVCIKLYGEKLICGTDYNKDGSYDVVVFQEGEISRIFLGAPPGCKLNGSIDRYIEE
ncbi:hypothetical protein IH879_16710 [candidate division KSB1 bacterium]|nr:hypothetical protein [candidate division KSB1 bacterium]